MNGLPGLVVVGVEPVEVADALAEVVVELPAAAGELAVLTYGLTGMTSSVE